MAEQDNNLELEGKVNNAAKMNELALCLKQKKVEPKLGKGHVHSRSRLDAIVLEHV